MVWTRVFFTLALFSVSCSSHHSHSSAKADETGTSSPSSTKIGAGHGGKSSASTVEKTDAGVSYLKTVDTYDDGFIAVYVKCIVSTDNHYDQGPWALPDYETQVAAGLICPN